MTTKTMCVPKPKRWAYKNKEGEVLEITNAEPADLPGFVRAIRKKDGAKVLVERMEIFPLDVMIGEAKCERERRQLLAKAINEMLNGKW